MTTALTLYRSLNGALPPPGLAWLTSTSHGGPFLSTALAPSSLYSLHWTGQLLEVRPRHGAGSNGNAGTASPPSGCYAA